MDSQEFDSRLQSLRNDRSSGAVDLAVQAIDLARDWIDAGRAAEDLAKELKKMHSAIATVGNVARLLEKSESEDLLGPLRKARESLVEGNQRIAENVRPLIRSTATVATISNSSTVRDTLIALQVGKVYVFESRPGGEGSQMAEALRNGLGGAGNKNSSSVQLVPDASMGNVTPSVDCVLVGIDSYDRSGAILHKVGTLPLALCCQEFRKDFYAAGHSFKFSDRMFSGLAEPDKPLESQLFDCTPASLISRLITEKVN